jgi:hypothetical protein
MIDDDQIIEEDDSSLEVPDEFNSITPTLLDQK